MTLYPSPPPDRTTDTREESYKAEVAYHRRFNLATAIALLPSSLFFAWLHHAYGFRWAAWLFGLISINIAAGVLLSFITTTLTAHIRIKYITYSISFALLAAILINGLVNVSLAATLPWVYFFPLIAVLIFGTRKGLVWALGFSGIALIVVLTSSDLMWRSPIPGFVKINSIVALAAIFMVAYLAEKNRMRVQNSLVASQEKYRRAEQQQVEFNQKLQEEIRQRKLMEEALAQSEQRYRALFENSPVPLSEED